ncbi:helix-turn-helix domain-containing protein [Agromyces bauzanensis]
MTNNVHESKDHGAAEAGVIDVPVIVMRVRRTCDLSQRELGALVGLDQSQIARIESSRRRVDMPLLAGILALAGYRIAILDGNGVEVTPVPRDVLRDNAGRRMPAHLDVRPLADRPVSALLDAHSDRPSPRAWYHHRARRDRRRARRGLDGEPDQPTYSGLAVLEQHQRTERRRAVQERIGVLLGSDCTCGDECWTRDRCADACTCRCEW